MGQILNCCNNAEMNTGDYALSQNTIVMKNRNPFQSKIQLKTTIETEQDYPRGQAVFQSKEGLSGVQDEYIQKQNLQMKRNFQNKDKLGKQFEIEVDNGSTTHGSNRL
eukprot:403356344